MPLRASIFACGIIRTGSLAFASLRALPLCALRSRLIDGLRKNALADRRVCCFAVSDVQRTLPQGALLIFCGERLFPDGCAFAMSRLRDSKRLRFGLLCPKDMRSDQLDMRKIFFARSPKAFWKKSLPCGHGGTADALVLGTSDLSCGFKSHCPHHKSTMVLIRNHRAFI